MLDLPRYLLGIAEILWLAGFATLGATALRIRLLPAFSGAPAHLATAVLALALLIWAAEFLGTIGLFEPLPYLLVVGAIGGLAWTFLPREASGWGVLRPRGVCGGQGSDPANAASHRPEQIAAPGGHPTPTPGPAGRGVCVATLLALVVAAIAVVRFGLEVKTKLGTGMTGFDSTWYHGPFAAGFLQSGDTWGLHFIAPQFLAWFYPANAELFHGVGMLAFDRDLLSPLLNLGWFVGCLVACWCIGRPYGVAPWSLLLGAVALSLPVLSDQAGEARNDIAGTFFLLAAVAIAVTAMPRGRVGSKTGDDTGIEPRSALDRPTGGPQLVGLPIGAAAVAALAAGLAAGTKLNFLLPAAVLVLGLAFIAPKGARWRALAVTALAALAGGGYWYLRNLVHSGNPLPWLTDLGPISLPGPDQALRGREGHSVLGYLTDGAVWSDWLLPGLRDGLTLLWPLLLGLALTGLVLGVLALRSGRARGEDDRQPARGAIAPSHDVESLVSRDAMLALAGLAGLAAGLAWLVAPTSASGPEGMPRGFESGLRYLVPAIVLGLALLPLAVVSRMPSGWRGLLVPGARSARVGEAGGGHPPNGRILKAPRQLARRLFGRGVPPAGPAAAALLIAIAIGYPVQRHYLENRYASPAFSTPGLNAAFKWARNVDRARIATTSTRQYPLHGTDLTNHVQFIGEPRPQGGFVAPTTCPQYRRLLNEGEYDYVIATRDRIEPGKPAFPATARWTEGPGATAILREPPTIVYQLSGPLDPSACPRRLAS